MGIMDFVRSGVQEMVIRRDPAHANDIIFKHPDATIPHFAQLTVNQDESAVFFRDGSYVGTLTTAGVGQRHTLSSQNIPFLSNIVDSVTGGNIFTTDLFFVTMRPILNNRFGGELGYIEDPMLGEMVTPRIFGEFAFQVTAPDKFITNYVGIRAPQGNEAVSRWLTGLFMNSVKTVIGEFCVSQQKSLMQLMPLQQQIAQTIEQRCPDLESIGVSITQIGQFNINLNEDDEARLREAQAEIGAAKRAARVANIGIAQAQAEAQQRQFELDQQYQQDARYVQGLAGGDFTKFAGGKMMMGAGEGMAQGGGGGEGGAAMQAAGMGAGFAMGNMFMGQMQTGQAAPPQAPPPTAPAPAAAGGMVTCPGCSSNVPPGKFCANCGTSLAPPAKAFCPSCGTEGAPGARFCANCGTSMP